MVTEIYAETKMKGRDYDSEDNLTRESQMTGNFQKRCANRRKDIFYTWKGFKGKRNWMTLKVR